MKIRLSALATHSAAGGFAFMTAILLGACATRPLKTATPLPSADPFASPDAPLSPISPSSSSAPTPAEPARVSVLTYNVENLFDTDDDPDKNDETFLPASLKESTVYQNKCRYQNTTPSQIRECLSTDWSAEVLERKLKRLTDVVEQIDHGRGPDILIIEETESLSVLDQWRRNHMRNMDYNTLVYIKGPDERGINPAIFSRLPLAGHPKLHPIDLSAIEENPRPTRGILEAPLRLPNGETLVVFAVHFPSQAAPTPFRKLALQTLLDIATTLPEGTKVMVGGDFNISAREEYKEHFFSETVSRHFGVSHLIGCQDCVGTIYYPQDRTWSFFDVLLFSPELLGGATWQVNALSIQVINSSRYQVRQDGTPARFGNGRGPVGVSDHWPMYAELRLAARPPTGDSPNIPSISEQRVSRTDQKPDTPARTKREDNEDEGKEENRP